MREPDLLLERLADANPVPEGDPEGAGRSSTGEDLLARLIADRSRPVEPSARRRRTQRAAAAGALLAAILGGALLLRGGNDAPASASELLVQTSTIAANRASPIEGGSYRYTKVMAEGIVTSDVGAGGWSANQPVVEEQWIGADGSGRVRSVFGTARFFGARDHERWEAAGAPEFPSGVSDTPFPPGTLPYEDLSSLPERVSALDSALRERVSPQDLPADVAVFLTVGDLLARGDASPGLRAALYRVAAQLPDVDLIGDATDPSGRPGVAVAMSYSDRGAVVQVVMIFDAQTSALLAQESVLLERASWVDAAPGTRLSFTSYLEAGWTESTGVRPLRGAGHG